jgi:hypothetical protein
MDSFEKLDRAIALQPTPEIPVYPHIVTFAGRCAGITQEQLFSSNKAWLDACDKTFERVGTPDVVFPFNPRDTAYVESMKVKLPGRDLGPDEPFQFVEEEVMQVSDYDVIVEQGWNVWNTDFMKKVQTPPWRGPFSNLRVLLGFIRTGVNTGKNAKHWAQRGLPMMFQVGVAPPFDVFSLSRSLRPFYRDLFERPEKVKKAVEVGTEAMIKLGITNAKRAKGTRVAIFAMRSSASFLSPKLFDEISFPSIKRMVEAYHAAGLTSVLHCDGNWDLMIPRFKELPRASCVVELDGSSDIRKAREVLHYCRNLIDFMGRDGGFILGSGCEVPITAKPENVAAMISAARR